MPEGISEKETAQRLMAYHRSIVRVLPSYPKTLKVISADQPCVDVFYQGERGAFALSPGATCCSSGPRGRVIDSQVSRGVPGSAPLTDPGLTCRTPCGWQI